MGFLNDLTNLSFSHGGQDTYTVDPNLVNSPESKPWLYEPEGSVSYDDQNGIALPAGMPSGFTLVESFIVPQGYDGVIKRISCNFGGGGFEQFSGDIIWQLRINGKPVRNYNNIRAEKGTIYIPKEISPIRLYSNDLVEWYVNHIANVGLSGQIITSLSGYLYPSRGVS